MKRKILVWLLPLIVVWFQRLIGLTSSFRILKNEQYEELFKNKKPYIYSIWHTNVLYSPYLHRKKRVAVLISESKDGDYINEVVHRFGNTSIRGSSSKGGSKALKAVIQHLKKVCLQPSHLTVQEGPHLSYNQGSLRLPKSHKFPLFRFIMNVVDSGFW